jgi:uncharacterized protein (DUF885 family)
MNDSRPSGFAGGVTRGGAKRGGTGFDKSFIVSIISEMTRKVSLGACACSAILFAGLLAPFPARAQPAAETAATAAQTLDRLFRAYERESAPYFPFTASENGDQAYDGVLANNLSDAYRAGLAGLGTAYLKQLQSIDSATLDPQRRLSYEIFEYDLRHLIGSFDYPWHLLPIDQVGSSLPSRFAIMGAARGVHPFRTVRNYEDFLKRIDGFVVWVDTAIDNMRIGMARGVTQPRDLMLKVVPQLDAQIVADPRTSLFHEPVRNFPDGFDAETRRALSAKFLAAIEQKIVPAYRKLRVFVANEYLPACRTSSGFAELPGGRAMYLASVRRSTTTDLSPAQIYDVGTAEVERIGHAIAALRAEIAASPDVALTRYNSVEDLLRGYGELRSAVAQSLPRLFGRFPRADFEIRPIEAFRENSMPSSYVAPSIDGARPGVFYLNAAALKTRGSAIVARSLFLHEAVPGHHFQIALQRENTDLQVFRKFGWYNAFGEGWALYAERLGEELGIYQNRRDRLGMLQDELFRAARLVVDVGIHEKVWTRQQAIDYMVKTVGASGESAVREVERYMAWPGQALSYKIGQLKILEIRNRAAQTLGSSFDIRAFHDELLNDGSMPLSILEAKMNRWIASQRTKAR